MKAVNVDVCVVGGGLSGLAAACALRQAGHSVALIERRADLGDPNRGDFLPHRAVELLKRWGVVFEGRPALEIRNVCVELGSRVIARRNLGTKPGLCLPYTQLELALRETAKALGVDLRLGWQLQGLTSNAGKTRVSGVTAIRGAEFVVFEAKLVIGADGRASLVREALALKMKTADKTCELLACEADLASPSSTIPDSVTFGIGRLGGGFATPLSNRRVRVVAVTRPGEADALSRQSPATLAQELPGRAPLPLGSSIDPGRLRSYDQTTSGHVPNYAAGGAVCIGDAAHPPPAIVSGLLMSLLDVDALVRHVSPVLGEGDKAIDKALSRFELERWPDNEARMNRGRTALKWMGPLSSGKLALLRTPLARLLTSSLTSAS